MTPTSSTRPTWTEISRAALRSNYRILRERAARVDADAVAVIKANAYGHGAVEALATLADDGCQWFAVTCLDEARLLAPQLASHRMLILSGLFIGEVAEVVRTGFTPVLGSVQELAWLSATTPQSRDKEPLLLHLEIDTGMARQGIPWDDTQALAAFAERLEEHPQLRLEGVMTHFASPEDVYSTQTGQQLNRFRAALATLQQHGCAPPLIHAGNSASLFEDDQMAHLREIASHYGSRLLLRPGIALYGYGPHPTERGLQPVLSWKTRITGMRTIAEGEAVSYNATFRAARTSRIAMLPVGYADGYSRLLSNRGQGLVRGQRAPIAGRVTMDQTMIDVTDIADAAIGDEVVLLGQQGGDRITADDIAAYTGTISYEVLCAIGTRVPRLWV
ncbi:MAG TPA: alanine racemase [Acidobacteriaceae bacterium]|jgi:alanine racemase|nr:alanine racemase [Acidobacteriaceae bacterium]